MAHDESTIPLEEAFGFAAREFLRKKILGKTIQFWKIKELGSNCWVAQVIFEEKDLSIVLLEHGLVDCEPPLKSDNDLYQDACQKAKFNKIGIWGPEKERQKRSLINFDPQKIPVNLIWGICEPVIYSNDQFVFYVEELNCFLTVCLPKAMIKKKPETQIFLENLILNRKSLLKVIFLFFK